MFRYKGKLISEINPCVYWARIWHKRLLRWLYWSFHTQKYKLTFDSNVFPYRYAKHSSKLTRNYSQDSQYKIWQANKIINLKLAIPKINHILIKPGQTFSFWKLVGRPTKKKGFVLGMELSKGKAKSGIGGGLCQLSNLLNWLAWHTPLKCTQRSLHSFDPFPDKNRVLPFGSGAAIFWNYVDWQVTNSTQKTFQIIVWIRGNHLKGEIRCCTPPEKEFSVFEKNHFFSYQNEQWYRSNEIWRRIFKKGKNGKVKEYIGEELLVKNWSKVCYTPASDSHNSLIKSSC